MKENSQLNFSAASSSRLDHASRAKGRLMLGLTARNVRTGNSQAEHLASFNSVSGIRWGSSFLDRLQSPLTRYRE